MTCNPDQLHRYHDRELDPVGAREVEIHLASCEACRELLADLRGMSGWIASAPLPEVETARLNAIARSAWHASSDRGVRRLAGWITAAAAAVMVFAIIDFPSKNRIDSYNGRQSALVASTSLASPDWERAAIMPPGPVLISADDTEGELVQFVQWMANDLSAGAAQSRR